MGGWEARSGSPPGVEPPWSSAGPHSSSARPAPGDRRQSQHKLRQEVLGSRHRSDAEARKARKVAVQDGEAVCCQEVGKVVHAGAKVGDDKMRAYFKALPSVMNASTANAMEHVVDKRPLNFQDKKDIEERRY
ncbi:hypothetical protein NDU88_007876 [Pleurodeles waltl]|uniref:Uncharacterized protein n=1 Tax=Pleurodeles waltl TaxID=8319 RepID=A0AAV7U158_PLEWA|nr:hypothetical protein NDU88_007876 [Pleurodeles waltl]